MINTLPRLSVWEIACRVNELDPSAIDSKNVPLKLKDALKSITRAIHYDENMMVLNNRGIENHHAINQKTGKRYDTEVIHELISDCYEKDIFDKEFLESIYIEDKDFAKWCLNKNIPLPLFWFPNGWEPYEHENVINTEKSPESENIPVLPTLKGSQIDKIVCQGIGRTLWDIYPNLTIADMCKHEAIQRYGNGKLYIGAHTLRDWLSEVAPDNIKGKKGRPKKSES